MCVFYYIHRIYTCIEYLIAGKTLLDYTNTFSSNDYQKNVKLICKYFKDKYGKTQALNLDLKVDETKHNLLEEVKNTI